MRAKDGENEKKCYRCQGLLAFDKFYKNTNKADGLTAECKACIQEIQAIKRGKNKTSVLAAYGGKCKCCGESAPEFLAVDHVNGDGSIQRKEGITGSSFYAWLVKNQFPQDNYRLLCHNCNCAIAFGGVCPHEEERRAANGV